IASAVVTAFGSTMRQAPPSVSVARSANAEAYNQFLFGRQHLLADTADDNSKAAAAFGKASALDPTFADGYAELAVLLDEDLPGAAPAYRALALADRAVTLAPDSALGYSARGLIRFSRLWDWSGARSDFDRALALAPGDAAVHRRYGAMLEALGLASAA